MAADTRCSGSQAVNRCRSKIDVNRVDSDSEATRSSSSQSDGAITSYLPYRGKSVPRSSALHDFAVLSRTSTQHATQHLLRN
jgi:hypothetical protein